jgi:hypothetical protein
VEHARLVELDNQAFTDLSTATANALEPARYAGGEIRTERDDVVGRLRRPSGGQGPGDDLHVAGADGGKRLGRDRGKRRVLLERDYRGSHAGKDGRRITGGTADIEHPIPRADRGRVDQLGQHHRLEQPPLVPARGDRPPA